MRPPLAVIVATLALLITVLCTAARAAVPQNPKPRPPAQIVKIVHEQGFRWRDAGIGAAVAGLSIVGLTAGSLLLLRLQRPPPKT
jgi:hypothetical protein